MSHSGFDKKELSNEPEIKLRCTLSRLCVLRCIHDVKLFLESTINGCEQCMYFTCLYTGKAIDDYWCSVICTGIC